MAVRTKTPRKKQPIKKNDEGQMDQRMLNFVRNSQLLSRSMLGSRLGIQFDGQRDLYESFGYKRYPDFQDYWNIYKRHGLGHRVIHKFADSTWNKTPVLIDGEQRSDTLDKGATPFLKEWVALAKRLGITQVMRQADIMAQIGQFSVLFLGASGNDYTQPAKKSDGLFFLSAYSEANTTISRLIQDVKNEKFGMPEMYTIQFNELDVGLVMPGGTNIHHTRVIHVAEDRLGSRIYGTPRLEAPLNRLWDLEKTTGGGAEAAWLATWGGILFTVGEDMSIPEEGSAEALAMDKEMQKYFHRQQRYAVMKGVEANNQGVSEVRIKDIYDTLKTDLAGTVGIPQRILFGSERGELASSQDMQEWNSLVETRRTNFAEPEVLYPFIDWCIAMDVLPAPSNKEYKAEWYPPYTMTDIEKAQLGVSLAQGANTITGGVPETAMDVNEWRTRSGLPAREDVGMEDETPMERKQRDYQERLKITSDTNIGDIAGGNGNNGNGKFPQRDNELALLKQKVNQNSSQLIKRNESLEGQIEGLKDRLARMEELQDIHNDYQRSWLDRLFGIHQNESRREPPKVDVQVHNYPGKAPITNIKNEVQPSETVVQPPGATNVYVQPTPIQNLINVLPTPIRNIFSPKVEPTPVQFKPNINIENKMRQSRIKSEDQTVLHDEDGNLLGSHTDVTYEEDDNNGK